MTVVIAGCGDLGTEAGLRFAALGHRVVGLRRSPAVLPSEIEGRAVDLSAQIPELPADTDIVVIATSADKRTVEAYRSAYVNSVRNVLAALDRDQLRPSRVLFVSSTAVYGVDDGDWVDESVAAIPATPTARVLLAAEEMLRGRWHDATVLRLSGIYGPGRTRLIDQARGGSASVAAAGFTNRIHRDDAAAAIVHLTTGSTVPGPLYLGTDDVPSDRRDVLEFLADALGVPAPVAAAAIASGKRIRNARLRSTGFTFVYPSYREGYRAILDGVGVRHP